MTHSSVQLGLPPSITTFYIVDGIFQHRRCSSFIYTCEGLGNWELAIPKKLEMVI